VPVGARAAVLLPAAGGIIGCDSTGVSDLKAA